MKSSILLIVSFLVISFQLNSQTITQKSSTTGITGGLELGSISWNSSDLEQLEYMTTVGLKAKLNYGIDEMFSLGLNYIQSLKFKYFDNTSFSLNVFQLEGRLHFGSTQSSLRPTIAANVLYSTSDPILISEQLESRSMLKGFGFGLNAGLKYFLNTNLSISGNVEYMNGRYTDNVFAGQEDEYTYNYNLISFTVGLNYTLVR